MSDVTLSQLGAVFDAHGMPHQIREADDVLLAALPARKAAYLLVARLEAERQVVVLHVGNLLEVPPERRAAIAQAAAHANARVLLGAFALDLADGELSFDLPIPYRGVGVGEAQIGHCLAAISWSLDEHLPLFQRLRWTEEAAEDVLQVPVAAPTHDMLRALLEADDRQADSA